METSKTGRGAVNGIIFGIMTASLPDIYLFNPTCEYAVANGRVSWQPNRLLRKMEEDLDVLPMLFARPNDIVLVKKLPGDSFIKLCERMGTALPKFVLQNEIKANPYFIRQAKNRLLPWGWSPATHHLLATLKPSCSDEFKLSPVAQWKPEHRDFCSRFFALQILKELLPRLPPDITISPQKIPHVVTSKEELECLIRQWGKVMVKAPWSSSGRGLQKITKTPVVEKVWEKLLGIIRQQGYALAEPLLNKTLDMAFQYELKKGKATFLGTSRFFTDDKGQYQGNYLNGWPGQTDPKVIQFAENLHELLIDSFISTIEKSSLAELYEGNFGVDMLIFRDKHGELKVNPCLEINVRLNMGLLSIQPEKRIAPGSKGIFQIFFQPNKTFMHFREEMEIKHPLKLKNSKIISGFCPLTPVFENTKFGAFILITG
jgi:hypothetical protein